MRDFTVTSTSLTPGHPDKLCDRIADTVVDRHLRLDPAAHVEVECAVSTGILFVACHTTSDARLDLGAVAREVAAGTGYGAGDGFDPRSVPVMASTTDLPPAAVGHGSGAGTVAIRNITTYGYACRDHPSLLPAPIAIAHDLARRLTALRDTSEGHRLLPDGQVQATVRYAARRPVAVEAVTLLTSFRGGRVPQGTDVEALLRQHVVDPGLEAFPDLDGSAVRLWVNPLGMLLPGGPGRHAGVTGRKIGVDTYGDFCRQPSVALSGKDPWRVDRAATYAARHAARNVVAAGLAEACEVQLAYGLGDAQPSSFGVETFGTGTLPDAAIADRLRACLDLRPGAVERRFALRPGADPGYAELAVFGHVGRMDLGVPWEIDDLTEPLRA